MPPNMRTIALQPPADSRLTIRLPKSLRRDLQAVAAASEATTGAVARVLLRDAIDRLQQQD